MVIFYKLEVGRIFLKTPTLKGTSDTIYFNKLCVPARQGHAAETRVVRGPEVPRDGQRAALPPRQALALLP